MNSSFFFSFKEAWLCKHLLWRIKVLIDRETLETLQAGLNYNSVETCKQSPTNEDTGEFYNICVCTMPFLETSQWNLL